jgi:hypothetical protein
MQHDELASSMLSSLLGVELTCWQMQGLVGVLRLKQVP